MILEKNELSQLAEEMPALEFDLALDAQWPLGDKPQAYLDYYRINFARELSGVRHGFGRVNCHNFRVATHYWLPENPKGTIVIVHGYYDHVGVYRNPILYALERGYAVLALDLPGHGLSSGRIASIDSFDQYADVLSTILNHAKHLLPAPWHAWGQSMGGAVLLNYTWRYSTDTFDKIALFAPLILPRGWRSGRMVYRLLKGFVTQIPRRFTANSHDQEFMAFISRRDPLQSQFLPVAWVSAMKLWAESFRHVAPIEKKILVVQGTGDRTVEWRYNLKEVLEKVPNAEVHLIQEAGHHLVNESPEYRDQLFEHIERYFFKS